MQDHIVEKKELNTRFHHSKYQLFWVLSKVGKKGVPSLIILVFCVMLYSVRFVMTNMWINETYLY